MLDPVPSLRDHLLRSWYSDRAYPALRPLAAIYGALLRVRAAAYRSGLLRSGHPGVPVVVIGNITVGGTGKTPLTLWLVQRLLEQGIRAGIATRGYGRRSGEPQWVTSDSDPLAVGDEPILLARRSAVPVCVAARRMDAARLLVARGCQLILCDDGLQHLALRRDLAILVVDAQRGFGNGQLLPAGPLREPPGALHRASLMVINGPQTPVGLPAGGAVLRMTLKMDEALALRGGARESIHMWRGQSLHAVAGIGNPQRFFAALRDCGIDVVEHAFPDHHRFSAQDFEFGDRRSIIMTEKDAVKCQALADSRMWMVPVTAEFSAADSTRLLAAVQVAILGGGRSGA